MVLTPDAILANPLSGGALRRQARAFLSTHEAQPRLASIFATHQRWLLSMLALALYLGREGYPDSPGLRATLLLDEAVRNDVASRNTAHSFLQEMQRFGLIEARISEADKRLRLLHAQDFVIEMLEHWMRIHFTTLDALDGGARLARFTAAPHGAARLQPLIVAHLLQARPIRVPGGTFAVFTWLDQGGLLMDWLIANMDEEADGNGRIRTADISITELGQQLGLSRSHLSRKLKEARMAGGIGWSDSRGQLRLWIADDFRADYFRYQACKLALIDQALAESGL